MSRKRKTTAEPRANAKRSTLWWLAGAAVLIAIVVGGYFVWRKTQRTEIPAIDLTGREPSVAQAIQQARQGVEQEPGSSAAWGNVGIVLFAHDDYVEAVPWFSRAEELDASEPLWPYLTGLALIGSNPDESLVKLKRAKELRPQDAHIQLRLAESLLKAEKYDEAEAAFDVVLRERRDDARGLLGRGKILSQRGQLNDAVVLLTKAAGDPTAQKSARDALVEIYVRQGNERAAAEQRQLALGALDRPWADPRLGEVYRRQTGLQPRLLRARTLLADNHFESAHLLLQQIVRDHPTSADALVLLGKILLQINKVDEANTILLKAIDIDSKQAEGYFLLAGVSLMRRNFTEAEARYKRAIDLRPTDATAHYNYALCVSRRNDKPGAIAALRDAVRYDPTLAQAHLALGELLLTDGQLDEAITSLENAARLEPGNENARDLLAKARSRRKP